jgi:hypothetical protein
MGFKLSSEIRTSESLTRNPSSIIFVQIVDNQLNRPVVRL